MAKKQKAKSKKSCGLDPFCHIMKTIKRIRTQKNRIKYDIEDALQGREAGNY